MAKRNPNRRKHLKETVETYLADPRLRSCLEASAELSALITLVRNYIAASACGMLPLGTQAILARVQALSEILQDGLGDAMVTTEQLAAVVHLKGRASRAA